MAELRALTALEYPADEESYDRAIAAKADGRNPRDNPDEFSYVRVEAGEFCDPPPQIRDHWLETGRVERVTTVASVNVDEAAALIASASADELEEIERDERARSDGPRVTVLRALESRRDELEE